MSQEERLTLLRADLQIATTVFDRYLSHLLDAAAQMIVQEGIVLTDSVEDEALRIMYAAYLYRKRADPESKMPRMLRYALNNRLMQGKVRADVT